MRPSQVGIAAALALVLLAGCSTPQRMNVYEHPIQVLAIPSCTAKVIHVAPCNAKFQTEEGDTFIIGGPGADLDVHHFVGTLEAGKTYYIPEAYMKYKEAKKPNKTLEH